MRYVAGIWNNDVKSIMLSWTTIGWAVSWAGATNYQTSYAAYTTLLKPKGYIDCNATETVGVYRDLLSIST